MILLHQAAQKAMEALKPCPFCGSDAAKITHDHGTYEPGCTHCGTYIGQYSSEQSAIAAWNLRPESALQQQPESVALAEIDRDTDGELLIDWSPGPGRMVTLSLRDDGRLSYAITWDAERAHGTAQMPAIQHQEEPPPECKTEEEKRAFAFGWWKAMEANRASCTGAYAFGVQEVPREPVADEQDCETCQGDGTINERLGGYWFSNPAATCPDCDGTGRVTLSASPSTTRQQEVGSIPSDDQILAFATKADMLVNMGNGIYGPLPSGRAKILRFARSVLAAAPSTPKKAGDGKEVPCG